MEFILYILIHFISSVILYGLSFSFFQKEYPSQARKGYKTDMRFCIVISLLLGPIGILFFIIFLFIACKKPNGFKLK